MMPSVESLRVGAALVARIDLGQDIVLISAPADRIATLERASLSRLAGALKLSPRAAGGWTWSPRSRSFEPPCRETLE
jgi:hypothetical protein